MPETRNNEKLIYRNNTLVFSQEYSSLHILLRNIKKLVFNITNVILFGLLLFNIWTLYLLGSEVNFSYEPWFRNLIYGTSGLVVWFWFLALFNLFLLYRLMRGDYWYKEISKKEIFKSGQVINVAKYLSTKVHKTLDEAWLLADSKHHKPVEATHVIDRLLSKNDILLLVSRLGLDIRVLQNTYRKLVEKILPTKNIRGLAPELEQIILKSFTLAVDKNKKRVELTDLFEALSAEDPVLKEVLFDSGVEDQAVSNVCSWIDFQKILSKRYSQYRKASHHKPKGPIDRAYLAAATPVLDRFSSDLTVQAKIGALPLAVGRDKEVEQIFRVIESGATSVLLVGENGVGKSSIVEGLANSMAAEDVPAILQDKRLVSLSIPFLIAGASEAGELQERMLLITQEVIRSGNIILYIEDIHNLVGVGAAGTENVDLSEVLAQQVKDPNVIVIASTTPKDYKEYIEGSTVNGGFTKIDINEPDRNNAIKILEANVGYLEAKQNVFFTHGALAKAVDLSDRYLHEQFLPSKAVKLVEEVASWASSKSANKKLVAINGEDVATLVSQKTNIPLSQMTNEESTKLLHLDKVIHQRIIGQTEAVQLVVTALQRARTELRDKKRPIVNLMFLGPTGVGKTELSKAVAESYFGDEERMIRLDMSEYQNQDSVARLIGIPGSGQGGILTEAVRSNPFSLLLLDEIEKAHPDILNIFLQVMDDGRLTDATGRTIDFTNVILVATSNAAAHYIQDQVQKNIELEEIKDHLVKEELRQNFRPEFLNRFDSIVVFKPLTKEEIFKIAGLMLKKVEKRLKDKGINLTVTEEAQSELAEAGFDPVFGARPLRRVIQEKVDNAIAKYLLTGSIGRRDTVVLKPGGLVEVDKATKLY